ncbi:MAG: ribosomal protein S18-alanine N-acetyltransferase [Candidatus Neomarinimicrobiota bacterium]|jgi:ribosomal-protein-alanine N-acetyltransferase
MIEIRDMHADDISEVIRIEKNSFDEPWTEMLFYLDLYTKVSNNWVLTLEEKIRAFVCFYLIADEIHLNNIAVDPDFRCQGLAQKLLNKMFEFAKEHEVAFITLEVNEHNDKAKNFYKKNGFKQVGLRPKYYEHDQADALIMTMEIKS